MSILKLEGANLAYQKVGQGPVLIFIPGANGTGDIFLPLAAELQEHFTVVTVDRRAYGKSEVTEVLPERASLAHDDYRVKRDAADIAALAKEVSDEPVYILGSSSGSIVAMHVLKDYPEVVKKIAFHEPPINTFLPDAKKWQDSNEEIVQTAINKNMAEAMQLFGKTLHIAPIDALSMSKPAVSTEDAIEKDPVTKQMKYWFQYEIRQYTSSDISVADFKPYIEKITLLNGTDSRGSFPQDVNKYLSEQTGLEIVEIPGGHLGYIQKPAGFAEVLLEMWR
ncbi:alpha/beta hydrolase [Listeria ivanovii]|uniref:alpha/beta fold hydrolase n=1 Tax=Listeria ivanovii TaxID=1638 RepID=UPI001629C372|nr:alpha/beta hydrolase [Listeria ivanovii]MBC2254822.1 alpha/beta hydrolase [Listeria ivanovii]